LPLLTRSAIAPLIALLMTSTAYAEDGEAIDGKPIIVTGTRDGYRTIDTTSGTKTRTPILDVPQTIDVVTDQQIKDQAIRSITDLVRLIPGISAGQGEGHRDQITLRGNNSTADFFVDGLRDDAQYYRSFYNVDRVEVHKGANAMIFGRGGGGGVVNRITKGALVGQNAGNATASADSFGSWYGAADGNVALNDMAALRVNGFYESLRNHRDAYQGHRIGVNPVLGAELDERTRVQIGYEFVEDDRVVDRGVPSGSAGTLTAPAAPLAGYRDAFFGVRGVNEGRFTGHAVTLRGETKLSDTLTLSIQGLFNTSDKIYTNAFPVTPPDPATQLVGINAYRSLNKRDTWIGQTNLEWRGDTGGISHILLLGGEFTTQDSFAERITGFFPQNNDPFEQQVFVPLLQTPTIPAPVFIPGPPASLPDPKKRSINNTRNEGDLRQASLYIQDQVTLSPHWQVVAGLRYDRLSNAVSNRFNGQRIDRVDQLWSPRAGLIFKPIPKASIYVSWARSYLPQTGDQFTAFNAQYANLAPERFDNYEVGAKWDITPRLTFGAAIYRLDRSNTRATDPVSGLFVLTGGQRSKGFEVTLTGKITDKWQTAMAYARTDAIITATTTAAKAGFAVAQVPRDQLSLWNRYDVGERIGVGLGIFHQSSQFASISNTVRLPAYTRVDGALFVKLTDNLEAQVNVENLFNATYFPSAHTDNNISTGAPRNARITVTAKF
jgi:catecholate siderophore receptor